MKFPGYPLSRSFALKLFMLSSNCVLEEFVLSSQRASPLTNPVLTPVGWREEKCVYWKVSVGLK